MHDRIYDNICQIIGKTPIVRLNRVPKDGWAEMLVKLEFFNPGGSVKDRIGLSMIEAAERDGRLKPGGTIIEPTSGNTGISFCALGRALGHPVTIFMPDWMSAERKALIRSFGAEIRLVGRDHPEGQVRGESVSLPPDVLGAALPTAFPAAAQTAVLR